MANISLCTSTITVGAPAKMCLMFLAHANKRHILNLHMNIRLPLFEFAFFMCHGPPLLTIPFSPPSASPSCSRWHRRVSVGRCSGHSRPEDLRICRSAMLHKDGSVTFSSLDAFLQELRLSLTLPVPPPHPPWCLCTSA